MNKISLFYQMRYDCLVNITCKNILFRPTFLALWPTFYTVVHFSTACSRIA